MSKINVDIDQVVLVDSEVDRADNLGALVESELQRLLQRGELHGAFGGGGEPLQPPAIDLRQASGDQNLARSIAQGITQALRGGN